MLYVGDGGYTYVVPQVMVDTRMLYVGDGGYTYVVLQVMVDTEGTTAGTMAAVDIDGDGYTGTGIHFHNIFYFKKICTVDED